MMFNPFRTPKQSKQKAGQALDDLLSGASSGPEMPIVKVTEILAANAELMGNIERTVGVLEYKRYYEGAVHRYIEMVHLLPASESHHHSEAGGMARHSLEVARNAVLRSRAVSFPLRVAERGQVALRRHWKIASFLSGLLHDTGKIVNDMQVVSVCGKHVWAPTLMEPIPVWAKKHKIDRYIVNFRTGRKHNEHELHNAAFVHSIIPKTVLEELISIRHEPLNDMLLAVGGNTTTSLIGPLVKDSDGQSVKEDLQSKNKTKSPFTRETPLERSLTDALRQHALTQIQSDRPDQTTFLLLNHTDDGELRLYGDMTKIANAIQRYARQNSIQGVPHDPWLLFETLENVGLVEYTQDESEEESVIHPQTGERRNMIRFSDPHWALGQTAFLKWPRHDAVKLTQPEPLVEIPQEPLEINSDATVALQPEKSRAPTVKPAAKASPGKPATDTPAEHQASLDLAMPDPVAVIPADTPEDMPTVTSSDPAPATPERSAVQKEEVVQPDSAEPGKSGSSSAVMTSLYGNTGLDDINDLSMFGEEPVAAPAAPSKPKPAPDTEPVSENTPRESTAATGSSDTPETSASETSPPDVITQVTANGDSVTKKIRKNRPAPPVAKRSSSEAAAAKELPKTDDGDGPKGEDELSDEWFQKALTALVRGDETLGERITRTLAGDYELVGLSKEQRVELARLGILSFGTDRATTKAKKRIEAAIKEAETSRSRDVEEFKNGRTMPVRNSVHDELKTHKPMSPSKKKALRVEVQQSEEAEAEPSSPPEPAIKKDTIRPDLVDDPLAQQLVSATIEEAGTYIVDALLQDDKSPLIQPTNRQKNLIIASVSLVEEVHRLRASAGHQEKLAKIPWTIVTAAKARHMSTKRVSGAMALQVPEEAEEHHGS